MAVTLIEAAKRNSGDVFRSAIIELYARSSSLLRVLPFENIAGNAYKYNQESAMPGIGFRGINEGFSESTGVINPQTEPLVIAGGDLDVDEFIIKTMGESQRSSQEAMKVKALAHTWTNAFFKGDSTTSPKTFDGLQVRLGGNQLLDAGASSGGDALSLTKLDELIDKVDAPSHLAMNKTMRRLLTQAARTTSVGGFIHYEKDEFGGQITMYNNLPILVIGENDDVFNTLDFVEANPGGGSNVGTSIYALSLREGMLHGIQNGDIDVRDIGELQSKPSRRTRVEWYPGLCLMHPRAAARLRGVKNAPIVA